MSAWLAAFLFTELVETPIYTRALRDAREGVRDDEAAQATLARAIAIAFAASALTHPIVWFVMPRLIPGDYLTMVAIAEAFAVLAEAAWMRAFGLRRALLWALFANASSLCIGLILRRTFGWP